MNITAGNFNLLISLWVKEASSKLNTPSRQISTGQQAF